MAAIVYKTRYDYRKATGDAVMLPSDIGNMCDKFIDITGTNPGYVAGDVIIIEKDGITTEATIVSAIQSYPHYYSLTLNKTVGGTVPIPGGTIRKKAAVIPSAVVAKTSKYLLYGLGILIAGVLIWKFGFKKKG
jgi:hypothetical protein